MFDNNIVKSLAQLNEYMKSDEFCGPSRLELRKMLSGWGDFKKTAKMEKDSLIAFTGNRPLVAVDGSRLEYGSFYPYYIVCLRTLAKCSQSIDDIDNIIDSRILTPVEKEFFNRVEEYGREKKITTDEAYRNILKESLAQMELETALRAMRTFNPAILIMDGGFLLFDKFPEWTEFCRECINRNTILIGVIEEVATAELARWLELTPTFRPRIYDRELLFGLLDHGEYIHFLPENRIKKDYCTVFARLASAPQSIGCDFLSEQENEVEETMNFLYSITPGQGQGIPAWLQIVDAEVRLRKKEVDRLVSTCVDKDLYEKYFTANRDRRIY